MIVVFNANCDNYDYLAFAEKEINTYNVVPLLTIANPKATDSQLYNALLHLGYVDEKATFWSTIVNNSLYSEQQRALCIYQLFTRQYSRAYKAF